MPLVLDDLYNEIADAIREKDGTTPDIQAATFAQRIRDIRTKNNISDFPLIIHSAKGAVITATQGDVSLSTTIDSSGTGILWLPTEGEWEVKATKGSYTSPVTIVEIHGRATLESPKEVQVGGNEVISEYSLSNSSNVGQFGGNTGDYAVVGGGGTTRDMPSNSNR
ncbi:MAG: hypothetical protein HDQ88_08515 [Clostridia bacterium]|nr:hypothetical protein [Clostridia bacterium]